MTSMIPAAGNDALPPQSTTSHSATDIPLHVQFATASKDGYPVRGEKNWQAWAQDLEDYGIQQENVANTRIPYASTLQLESVIEDYGMTPVNENLLMTEE